MKARKIFEIPVLLGDRRRVFLFRELVVADRSGWVGSEIVVEISMQCRVIPEDRAMAIRTTASSAEPVVAHANLARSEIDQLIERTCDHHVKVKT